MIYEKYNLLFETSPGWKIREVGFSPDNAGDCITRSCKTKKVKYIETCADLLMKPNRSRWPKEFQEEHKQFIAKGRIDWEWSKLRYNIHKWRYPERYEDDYTGYLPRRLKKLRPQSNSTRDGFVYFFAACAEHNLTQFIEAVTVPLHLYRRKLWVLRKYLIHGNPKHLKIYERLELRSLQFAHKYYVVDLIEARAEAAKSKTVIDALYDYDKELPDENGHESRIKQSMKLYPQIT